MRRESIDRTQHQVHRLKTGKLKYLETAGLIERKYTINAHKEDCRWSRTQQIAVH
jgi:hypothetical protein